MIQKIICVLIVHIHSYPGTTYFLLYRAKCKIHIQLTQKYFVVMTFGSTLHQDQFIEKIDHYIIYHYDYQHNIYTQFV